MTTPANGISGKLLIALVLAFGLAAAAVSWWFRYSATHRAAQFWGADAELIRDARAVELIQLENTAAKAAASPESDAVDLGGRTWRITDRRNLHQARGLVHLRNALVEDDSFEWPSRDEVPAAAWRWGLKFTSADAALGPPSVTVWFSADCRWAMTLPLGAAPARVISCAPIAGGLHEFFSEQNSQG